MYRRRQGRSTEGNTIDAATSLDCHHCHLRVFVVLIGFSVLPVATHGNEGMDGGEHELTGLGHDSGTQLPHTSSTATSGRTTGGTTNNLSDDEV